MRPASLYELFKVGVKNERAVNVRDVKVYDPGTATRCLEPRLKCGGCFSFFYIRWIRSFFTFGFRGTRSCRVPKHEVEPACGLPKSCAVFASTFHADSGISTMQNCVFCSATQHQFYTR